MANQKKLPKGITYRKDGRYMWRFSHNRRTYCGYAARLSDAEKALLDARYRVENGIYGKEGSHTMDEWFDIWLQTFKASIKESTRIKYRQMYSCHVQNCLGQMRLRKITPELLQDLLNRVSQKGLTAASVNAIRSMLCDLFETACRHQILRANPMDLVHLPLCKKNSMQKSAFTESELAEFIRRAETSRYRNIYHLSILTGFRIGEILALQWKDIDNSMQKIIDGMRRDGWLDPGKRYTFHSFRHTFATNCTRKGMHMKTLSTILGHSSIRITMDIYTHIGLEDEREELRRIFQIS